MDQLVQSLCIINLSTSHVSELSTEIDTHVQELRTVSLAGPFTFLAGALVLEVRDGADRCPSGGTGRQRSADRIQFERVVDALVGQATDGLKATAALDSRPWPARVAASKDEWMSRPRSKCSRSGPQRRGIILAHRVAGLVLSCPRDWRPDISSRGVA